MPVFFWLAWLEVITMHPLVPWFRLIPKSPNIICLLRFFFFRQGQTRSSYLSLLSTGITGMYHQLQFFLHSFCLKFLSRVQLVNLRMSKKGNKLCAGDSHL
jgi:hypothetical protein